MMSDSITENNPGMSSTDNVDKPDRLINTAANNTVVEDNSSRPTRKRFTKVYPYIPQSAIKQMQVKKRCLKRKLRRKPSSTPANYKRKIISLINSLEKSTLETSINDSTKKDLVDQFEIMKTQIMVKLNEIKMHLEIMRSYDEASKRRDRQKVYRQQKLERVNPINVENDNINETFDVSSIDIPDIQTILNIQLGDINIDCFNEF